LQDRGDTQHLPAREFVVMQMAQSLGINIPEIKLLREGHREIFLIERFDRASDPHKPQRNLFASAHTILRLPSEAVRGDVRRSYLVFADNMRKWIGKGEALQADLRELWKRMAFNALVGNHDDHPRNHGLIYDECGWRLSKEFDITPLQTFSKALAMGITPEGITTCSVENLLLATRYFDIDLEEASSWLLDASKFIADHWRANMRQAKISNSYLEKLSQAFSFAEEVASDISLIESGVELTKEVYRYPRKRY
jgi:serine/threonine-protein kinase HipA